MVSVIKRTLFLPDWSANRVSLVVALRAKKNCTTLVNIIDSPKKKGNNPGPGFLNVPKPYPSETIIMSMPKAIKIIVKNISGGTFRILPDNKFLLVFEQEADVDCGRTCIALKYTCFFLKPENASLIGMIHGFSILGSVEKPSHLSFLFPFDITFLLISLFLAWSPELLFFGHPNSWWLCPAAYKGVRYSAQWQISDTPDR